MSDDYGNRNPQTLKQKPKWMKIMNPRGRRNRQMMKEIQMYDSNSQDDTLHPGHNFLK